MPDTHPSRFALCFLPQDRRRDLGWGLPPESLWCHLRVVPCPVYVAHTLSRVIYEGSLELQPQRLGFDPNPPVWSSLREPLPLHRGTGIQPGAGILALLLSPLGGPGL